MSPSQAVGVFLNVTIFWGQQQEECLRAFIDSGAAGNFVDAALARMLKLPLVALEHPLQLSTIDGQSFEPVLPTDPTTHIPNWAAFRADQAVGSGVPLAEVPQPSCGLIDKVNSCLGTQVSGYLS